MEKRLKELLEHIEENTSYLYTKDVSNDTLAQNLMSRGMQYVMQPSKQNTVDLCTLALVLYLRKTND